MHRLQVLASVTPPAAQRGGAVSIVVELRNNSDSQLTVHFPSSCRLEYTIEDGTGKPVRQDFPMCLQVLTELKLGAGESIQERFSLGAPTGERWDLPPGKYVVRPRLMAPAVSAAVQTALLEVLARE